MSNKKIFLVLLSFCWINFSELFAQEQKIADSLALIYEPGSPVDTIKLELLKNLSFHEIRDLKKALHYAEDLISLSEKNRNKKYLRIGYYLAGTKQRLLGNLELALADFFKSADIARELQNLKAEGESYGAIADIYSVGNNYTTATDYYNKAILILRKVDNSVSLASFLSNAGDAFLKAKKFDSALLYFTEAKLIFNKVNYLSGMGYSLGNIGMVYASIGENNLAEKNMNEAIAILEKTQDFYPICVYLTSMADVYLNKGDMQAALNYTLRSLHLAEQHGLKEQVAAASLKLSEHYEKEGNLSAAFTYFKRYIANRDSVNNIISVQKMADLRTDYEVSQKQTEVNLLQQQKRNQRDLAINLAIILGLSILILGILIRNNKHRQKAYKVLNLQKQETDAQKAKAEEALSELQVTQKQLIQSAKMVSLGELTAGIAHEIQNPLNFVNNFSEVSVELLDELKEGPLNKLAQPDKGEADEIINVLADSLKKISDHGKRADAIVKGMLQHSRTNTEKKEQVDINAFADEYLRLSYHGLRAKDKEFRSNFKTSFDESIGRVEVVPQDLGRVLLNLYNNAFYAVYKKKKEGSADFEPQVSVTTKRFGERIAISIRDNGMGIPKKILDKIFQPFFTTKPTGQGTGLGLSLSYDIINAHGGEIKVDTQEGAFAEFSILLPAK